MTLPQFKSSALLRRALTHRSYANENPPGQADNERLEFLGDAVLDFLSAAFVYRKYPELSEGRLTRLRAALVRTERLAAFAAALGIGPHIRLGRGEEEAGGRERPSILCATFEAVVGAYYLDSGIEAVQAFVEPLFEPAAEEIWLAEADVDAKSLLQERAQAEFGETPRYNTVAATGPDHSKQFTVEVFIGDALCGTGTGPNKQLAAQAAAEMALQSLNHT